MITDTHDRSVVLSSLWTFAMFNYLYADVFTVIFNAQTMAMAGRMSEGVILGWTVFMETAIAMVVLSRVLKQGLNRWANVVVGLLHTASVAWTLLGGGTRAFYAFFAVVEISCTVFIIWYAWTWKPQAAAAAPAAHGPII